MLTEGTRALCGHVILYRDRFTAHAEQQAMEILDDASNKNDYECHVPTGHEPMDLLEVVHGPLSRDGWEDALSRNTVLCTESYRMGYDYTGLDGVLGAVCEHQCERTGLKFLHPGRCAGCPCGGVRTRQFQIEEAVRSNRTSSELLR